MKAFFLVLAAFLVGCSSPKPQTFSGQALGTLYNITYLDSAVDPQILQGEVTALLDSVENSMSLYRDSSLLSRLNRNQTDTLDRWLTECITMGKTIYQESGRAYDITIKPLTDIFRLGETDDRPNSEWLMSFVGSDKISIESGRLVKTDTRVEIDLNSIAKGYAVDLVAQLIESRGIANYLVEIGGEIFCRGTNPKGTEWTVGVDRPTEGNFDVGADLQAVVRVSGNGLATSGNYRQFHINANGEKVVHIVDPRTGLSRPSTLLSATVIAPSCAMADGYATALMVMGVAESRTFLESRPDLMGLLIFSDSTGAFNTYVTPNLRDKIVTQ